MWIRQAVARIVALAALVASVDPALAQDTPAPAPAEPPAAAAPSAEWWIFSTSTNRTYLINTGSIGQAAGTVTVHIASVPREAPAGDYGWTQDRFAVRCAADQSRVEQTIEMGADGQPTEPYDTDEPWEPIRAGSIDDGVQEIACEDRRPPGPSYPSIRAFMDARP